MTPVSGLARGPARPHAARRASPGLAIALLAAACASSAPPPAPAPAPAPEVPAPPPPAPRPALLAPSAVAGSYRLRSEIASQSRREGRRRTVSTLILRSQALAAPVENGPGQGFNANISLPGYTQAPRGRTTQSAAWWPVPGDSVVVQFAEARRGQIQLRGAVTPRTITGEIWYVAESGSTFQLGTFTAQRRGR